MRRCSAPARSLSSSPTSEHPCVLSRRPTSRRVCSSCSRSRTRKGRAWTATAPVGRSSTARSRPRQPMVQVRRRGPAAWLHDGPRPADAAPSPGHRSGQHLRVERGAPTTPEVEVGQALADVATVGLLQERSIREACLLNEQLHAALHSRIVVEQAKGMLAELRLIEMDVAFETLGATRATPTRSSAMWPTRWSQAC